jgi:hypothetical protein
MEVFAMKLPLCSFMLPILHIYALNSHFGVTLSAYYALRAEDSRRDDWWIPITWNLPGGFDIPTG